MSKGVIVSPANRGVQVVITDDQNVQLLVDSNRNINLEVVPQGRTEVIVDKGVAGPQGPQGPQGNAATIAVGTTTTGAAGTNASVTNSGTSSAAVFDFTIPRGDTGATGATGAGVAAGGTTGQVLVKASNVNYDTTWSTITGVLVYQGSWNASTNTPTLTSSVGTNGYYYVVGTSGSTNLNGITDWIVGDWAIFNGSVWQKIDNTDLVASVNGQTGVVVLTASSVGALAIANNLSDLANAGTARTNLGLGTIATQDANAVAITGGTIDNTTIGSTTPNAATFTTLTATGQTSLGGDATNPSLVAAAVSGSTRWLQVAGSASGNVTLSTQGTGTPSFVFQNRSIGPFSFSTAATLANEQFRISHTASAVNYVQVTGAATGGTTVVSSQGSDASVNLGVAAKGSGVVRLFTGGTTEQFRVLNTASAVNFATATGSAAGNAVSFSVAGTDTNISQVFQSKGTGAIDLSAGSSGVNISNGGTVTAITATVSGTGYTSIPSVAVSAPTTAGGVQATASALMFTSTATIQSGGTGYTNGDVLTIVGGTTGGAVGTYTVTGVSGGVITSVSRTTGSGYSVLPSNPVSVTGGTGSGATLNLTWTVSGFTITAAGSGYVEQPTVTFSGGGGSGAAAYATVGSGTVVRSLGSTISFFTPGGEQVRVTESAGTAVNYVSFAGSVTSGSPSISSAGSDTNINFVYVTKGTGEHRFATNASGSTIQARIAHTTSAVNYVQVTGGVTAGGIATSPTIGSQGSDANVSLNINGKGNGGVRIGAQRTNFVTVGGSGSGGGLASFTAEGGDTNIDLALTPKGTGNVRFGTHTSLASTTFSIGGYIEIKDSSGTLRKLAVIA